ncbi:MAG: hypothetical protein H6R00_1675 [Proteobacteria bacterium]|nr:hypothetical protein [Pseudomonadota bacterium]
MNNTYNYSYYTKGYRNFNELPETTLKLRLVVVL